MNTEDHSHFDNQVYKKFSNPSLIERDLQRLAGLISGIGGDKEINQVEYTKLVEWINEKKDYENKQPYSQVIQVLRDAINDKFLSNEESENIIWLCNQYIETNGYFNAITGGIQRLHGIIAGISIDGIINDREVEFLDNWLEENDFLKNTWPYDELYNVITMIVQDNIVTEEEKNELLQFCKSISSEHNDETNDNLLKHIKTGFYQIDPEVIIPEKNFCITGKSRKYNRKEIAEKIELYGGYVSNNVSSKLDYLIVCDEKNSCWAFSCYGRKVEEAIKHRKSGSNMLIIHEFDLFDALSSLSD